MVLQSPRISHAERRRMQIETTVDIAVNFIAWVDVSVDVVSVAMW